MSARTDEEYAELLRQKYAWQERALRAGQMVAEAWMRGVGFGGWAGFSPIGLQVGEVDGQLVWRSFVADDCPVPLSDEQRAEVERCEAIGRQCADEASGGVGP